MATMSEREHQQAKKAVPGRLLIREEKPDADERAAAMRRVQWTMCKGFANPNEMKEFNRLWNRIRETNGSAEAKQELEDWIEGINKQRTQ